MKLRLVRHLWTKATIGDLYMDGTWFCHTLEDQDRALEDGGIKIPAETAIPLGAYQITIDFSNRFHREMLHVLDVPQFDGVRIHAGNSTADTEGCILVGEDMEGETLSRSRIALERLQHEVAQAVDRDEDVMLSIERE